jgi:nucleoside-diphosphate-sugar epimerase
VPVWVIGAERGPRAALRGELIERGHDAVGFETLRDAALTGRLPGAPRPALAVLDLHDQRADDRLLDALFALGAPVIAVAGATEEGDPALRARPWARWLRRPLTLGAIADAVGELLGGTT